MKTNIITLCAVIVMSAGIAYATPIVTVEDANWSVTDDDYFSATADDNLGGLPAARIDYTGAPDGTATRIYTEQADAIGNWNALPGLGGASVHTLSFNFYMEDNAYGSPALSLYFADTGAATWFYDLTPPGISQGWNSFNVSVLESSGWYSFDGTAFGTSMEEVAQFGIEMTLADPTYADQIYGINDFTLGVQIPEPHEWALIIFAMLSLCTLYRRELQAQLEAALAKVRS